MTSIKVFKVKPKYFDTLTNSEKRVLPFLIKAAKIIDKIYLKQENHINNGANLYPRDAIKTEVLATAQDNPKILSPFTLVKRNKNGKLIAVDYHKEYRKELLRIASYLNQASKISKNNSFKVYLKAISNSLLSDEYTKADKQWLAVKNSNIDIVIGPYERYLDKLFFVKRAYQAAVCIIDKENTQKAKNIRDIIYTTISPNNHRVIPPKITDIQVRQAVIFAGFLGRALFTQQHLPAESESVEKYGSRILGFESCINYKFEKILYPIFCSVFEKNFQKRYTKQIIKKGFYLNVLLGGIVQHLHRYKGSRTRLKDLFPIFDEANIAAAGVQHAKYLVLKGVIDQKELESIMISQICWGFSEMVLSKTNSTRDVYLKGDSIIFNFLRREGALLEKEGISWPNFAKMFFEMENLAAIFTRILETGTYPEAQEFLSTYMSLDSMADFEPKLTEIKPL